MAKQLTTAMIMENDASCYAAPLPFEHPHIHTGSHINKEHANGNGAQGPQTGPFDDIRRNRMGQEKDQEGHHNDKQGRNPRLRKDRNHIAQSKDSKDNQKRSPTFPSANSPYFQ